MAGSKSKKKRKARRIKVPVDCPFCKEDREPSYKEPKELKKYMSDRAKIYGKDRTGVCARHQRSISVEIKRARHLGLLPFAGKV